MNKLMRLSDADLKDVYDKLPRAFRGIRPRRQDDIDARAMILESAYNQVAACRDKAYAARALAEAMTVLEEHAAEGGWIIPERFLPILRNVVALTPRSSGCSRTRWSAARSALRRPKARRES